jgi:hypothetical protein
MNPPDQPTATPRTDSEEWTAGHGTDDRTVVWSDLARTLERELASAKAERDLNITRVACILWSGAIDKHTCGDVQKWADDYTAELTAANKRIADCEFLLEKFTTWLNVEIAKREKAEAELANIANAKPDTWGDMSDSFQAWAQNRARHALAAMKEQKS